VAAAIDLDAVFGDTRELWNDWLKDVARKFRTIAELDIAGLPADRAAAAATLDRWAEHGIGDWRAALERFAEDCAPIYLRPDPGVNATLRALQAAGARLAAFTDAPEPLARVAASQLGVARRLEAIEAGEGALARVLATLGPDAAVVRTPAELRALAE
jgi:phosphoglycolate phosphatase-like HAD superfamily hydrolase